MDTPSTVCDLKFSMFDVFPEIYTSWSRDLGHFTTLGLRDLVCMTQGMILDKALTTSDWMKKTLDEDQEIYALNDVYAILLVSEHTNTRRRWEGDMEAIIQPYHPVL